MKANLDVIKSLLLDVPIGIGLLAGVLAAFGLSDSDVKYYTGIVVALAALGAWVIVSIKRAFNQTDGGKAATFEKLDPAGKAAVLERLPAETKLAAVNALPDVVNVEVAKTATNGTRTAALDPSLDKVNLSNTVVPMGKT